MQSTCAELQITAVKFRIEASQYGKSFALFSEHETQAEALKEWQSLEDFRHWSAPLAMSYYRLSLAEYINGSAFPKRLTTLTTMEPLSIDGIAYADYRQ